MRKNEIRGDKVKSTGSGSRVNLVDDTSNDPIVAEVFTRFAMEDRAPIALYRALAHSPAILRAYGALASGLRNEATVARELRELVILRVAQLTGSEYEWAHHRFMAEAVGLRAEQVACLADWRVAKIYDERQRAALELVDEVHVAAVTDATFDGVRSLLGDTDAVELLVVAAFYEAVARITQGLGVEVEPTYLRYLGMPDADEDGATV